MTELKSNNDVRMDEIANMIATKINDCIRYTVNNNYSINLPQEIANVIISYFHHQIFRKGMVFYGHCTQKHFDGLFNQILLITNIYNIKLSDNLMYISQFDIDCINIWPKVNWAVTNGKGTVCYLNNNEYTFTFTEIEIHKLSIAQSNQKLLGTQFNLKICLPSYHPTDCVWNNWNDYIFRIKILPSTNFNNNDLFGDTLLFCCESLFGKIDVNDYLNDKQRYSNIPQITLDTAVDDAVQIISKTLFYIDYNVRVCGYHVVKTELIERVVMEVENIVQCQVVLIPHEIKTEAIFVYAMVKSGVELSDILRWNIKQNVRTKCGAFFTPEYIMLVYEFPKTKKGKIMRKILKSIACQQYENVINISNLANPHVVQQLIIKRKFMK